MQYRRDLEVLPGESIHTFRSFVAVHNGDYFQTLLTFRKFMSKQGFQMAAAPDDGFGAIWCAWGYGRNFKPQQVYDSLPTVKKMGFKWVTLDDGWQNNYGDWQLDPEEISSWRRRHQSDGGSNPPGRIQSAALVVAAERCSRFQVADKRT